MPPFPLPILAALLALFPAAARSPNSPSAPPREPPFASPPAPSSNPPSAASAPQRETSSLPALAAVDFHQRFAGFDACFVLHHPAAGWTLRYNDARSALRLTPCSTFKIPNSLIGLETGLLADENHAYKWDGTKHRFDTWNRDHTLASAMQSSALWYYQRLAREVGRERMQTWIDRCNYGNRDTSGGIDKFWLESSLAISADEQVAFLTRLYDGTLPFSPRSVDIVRRILVLKKGDGWTFSGKTGSGKTRETGSLGWFVGCLERGEARFIFAANIRAEAGADGRVARRVVEQLLADLGLLPAEAAPRAEAAQGAQPARAAAASPSQRLRWALAAACRTITPPSIVARRADRAAGGPRPCPTISGSISAISTRCCPTTGSASSPPCRPSSAARSSASSASAPTSPPACAPSSSSASAVPSSRSCRG